MSLNGKKKIPYILSPDVSGIKYIITNKNDRIQNTLMNGQQWNSRVVEIIKNYIQNNGLNHLLNVGSHIGSVCLPISKYIKKVTAVEAFPPTYRHLCGNININRLSNVFAYNVALGNSNEDVYFMGMDKICPIEKTNRLMNNTGGMHVFTKSDIDNNVRSGNLADTSIKNKVFRLDDISIDNFDILLVDIEGFEYDFLLGGEEKIKNNKPIIIIEIWGNNKRIRENMSQTQEEVVNYILSLGYSLVQSIEDDFIFEPL